MTNMDSPDRNADLIAHLRRLAGDPEATEAQEEQARARLDAAIAAEAQGGARRRRQGHWPWLAPAAAVAALAATVVIGMTIVRPGSADAVLMEFARAARLASPVEVASGSLIHAQTSQDILVSMAGSDLGLDRSYVAFMLPVEVETWSDPETGFLRTETTNGRASFFDPEAEAAFQNVKADFGFEEGTTEVINTIGATNPLHAIDWPTTGPTLRQSMEDHLADGADERPLDVRLFDLSADLLRHHPDPAVRAAVIEVLATLDLDEIAEAGNGSVTATITDHGSPRERMTLVIDHEGNLRAETTTILDRDLELGIPAGFTISSRSHQPLEIVDGFSTP